MHAHAVKQTSVSLLLTLLYILIHNSLILSKDGHITNFLRLQMLIEDARGMVIYRVAKKIPQSCASFITKKMRNHKDTMGDATKGKMFRKGVS